MLTDQRLNEAVAISRNTPGPVGLYIVSVGYFVLGSEIDTLWIVLGARNSSLFTGAIGADRDVHSISRGEDRRAPLPSQRCFWPLFAG
jgi:hypothetical protein